jgi:hypothetical protein
MSSFCAHHGHGRQNPRDGSWEAEGAKAMALLNSSFSHSQL